MGDTHRRIAIIGGGISGTCAANRLISLRDNTADLEIVLFDQGGRGPGGRASHRRVRIADGHVMADDVLLTSAEASENYQFDHGCQFFCASNDTFREKIHDWCTSDVVRLWSKRCALISIGAIMKSDMATDCIKNKDFFGILSGADCYVGVGGMHSIARYEASAAVNRGVIVRSGVRVSKIVPISKPLMVQSDDVENKKNRAIGVERNEKWLGNKNDDEETWNEKGAGAVSKSLKWELFGVGGSAALHDTAEIIAAAAQHHSLGCFHSVIVTDASCSFEGWHRASAGISTVKPEFGAYIKSRARIPLFTVMVAFDSSVADSLDAAVFDFNDSDNDNNNDNDDNSRAKKVDLETDGMKNFKEVKSLQDSHGLWFAAKNSSKAGFLSTGCTDVWTLVSTPSFAVSEISTTTMQDKLVIQTDKNCESHGTVSDSTKTSVFKPQENTYLNEGPALTLVRSFLLIMKQMRYEKNYSESVDVKGVKRIFLDPGSDGPIAAEEGSEKRTEERKEPNIVYLQGQRWGSALPGDFLPENIDVSLDSRYKEVEGVIYQRKIPDLRLDDDDNIVNIEDMIDRNQVDDNGNSKDKSKQDFNQSHVSNSMNICNKEQKMRKENDRSNVNEENGVEKDYLYDDELGLYYCGDFCSKRVAGVQAAVLSGIDAADHIYKTLLEEQGEQYERRICRLIIRHMNEERKQHILFPPKVCKKPAEAIHEI